MSQVLESMHPLLYPATTPPVETARLLPYDWLLPAGLLLAFVLVSLWLYRRSRPNDQTAGGQPDSQLSEALNQLQQLPRPGPDDQAGPWLQQLNLLLKRFCAVRYPDIASHRLSGREWLAFLDSRCPAAGLTRWMILVQGSYQPDCRLDENDINGLHNAIATWMRAHV